MVAVMMAVMAACPRYFRFRSPSLPGAHLLMGKQVLSINWLQTALHEQRPTRQPADLSKLLEHASVSCSSYASSILSVCHCPQSEPSHLSTAK